MGNNHLVFCLLWELNLRPHGNLSLCFSNYIVSAKKLCLLMCQLNFPLLIQQYNYLAVCCPLHFNCNASSYGQISTLHMEWLHLFLLWLLGFCSWTPQHESKLVLGNRHIPPHPHLHHALPHFQSVAYQFHNPIVVVILKKTLLVYAHNHLHGITC